MSMRCLLTALAICAALPGAAQDVFVLGEIHDNPHHHAEQADHVAELQPAAIVFEMLTEDQAARVTPDLRSDADALAAALDWDAGGWPDFSMYHPIFSAAPEAAIYGALVPRDAAPVVFEDGPVAAFEGDAARYGLDQDLPENQQAKREALQMQAHCDALPEDILPGMVAVQRLRDAELARVTLQAMDETGGPVAVITGNGHARRDWGMPAMLERAAPDLDIWVLGQTEEDRPLDGDFDRVKSAPEPDRPDPCAAFQ
ncbi:MAG: ChaN family lipoprotein [Roseovarius sp.]